jgi:hypothetical protein
MREVIDTVFCAGLDIRNLRVQFIVETIGYLSYRYRSVRNAFSYTSFARIAPRDFNMLSTFNTICRFCVLALLESRDGRCLAIQFVQEHYETKICFLAVF